MYFVEGILFSSVTWKSKSKIDIMISTSLLNDYVTSLGFFGIFAPKLLIIYIWNFIPFNHINKSGLDIILSLAELNKVSLLIMY